MATLICSVYVQFLLITSVWCGTCVCSRSLLAFTPRCETRPWITPSSGEKLSIIIFGPHALYYMCESIANRTSDLNPQNHIWSSAFIECHSPDRAEKYAQPITMSELRHLYSHYPSCVSIYICIYVCICTVVFTPHSRMWSECIIQYIYNSHVTSSSFTPNAIGDDEACWRSLNAFDLRRVQRIHLNCAKNAFKLHNVCFLLMCVLWWLGKWFFTGVYSVRRIVWAAPLRLNMFCMYLYNTYVEHILVQVDCYLNGLDGNYVDLKK